MSKVIDGMYIGVYANDNGTKSVRVNTLTKHGIEKKVEKKDPPVWNAGETLVPPAEVISYVDNFLSKYDLD